MLIIGFPIEAISDCFGIEGTGMQNVIPAILGKQRQTTVVLEIRGEKTKPIIKLDAFAQHS